MILDPISNEIVHSCLIQHRIIINDYNAIKILIQLKHDQ